MSLHIKGCMMFDRQAQDPSDVTVASSQAPTIHTQEGDKDSSEEEDDEEEQDMDVDSTATKKSGNQATFMSFGMGKQLSAGSADAEAAMGQMTLENIPTEIQHGQQQNVEDMDDASMSAISVLLDAPVDFEDNNPSPAEKPSEVMDLAQDGTADNPVPLQGSSSTSESKDSNSEDSTAA
jgi:hypothetical protein